jgi:hypothetical protein
MGLGLSTRIRPFKFHVQHECAHPPAHPAAVRPNVESVSAPRRGEPVTFRSKHALFCSTGVTLFVREQNMTMQPLFHFKARLEPQSAAPLTRVPFSDVLQAQARQAECERKLAQIAHALRNRLGAITAAVEVLNISEPGGELAAEAQAVIGRQTRLLAQMLHEQGVLPREPIWDGARVEQIVVDTAASWFQSPPLVLSLRGAGEESRLVLESK